MPNYTEWNHALVAHFTAHVPRYSPVRLSVTDDALLEIYATHFNCTSATAQQARDDFLSAVRAACVSGQSVSLPPLAFTTEGEPRWAAFLAAMVDAAYRMTDDDDAAGHNYFTRLRSVLGLGIAEGGRPDGMRIFPFDEQSPEAPLWQGWNAWLSERGWIPTAALRPLERRHWTDYPISQTLLRDGDRQRIASMLDDERSSLRLPPSPDPERIAAFLRRCVDQMPKHLRPLIRRENRMDAGRFEELVQEVQELALAGTSGAAASRATASFQQATRLTAGLYRYEDAVNGVLEYRLFPRQPLRYQGEAIRVRFGGEDRQLQPFALRWFRWLGPVPLHAPEPAEIVGHPRLTHLVLPASTFWVFVRQSGETGPWATWRRPELGDRFLLLCRPCHEPHLGVLREGKLMAWDQVCERAVQGERWLEYLGCRVEASNWNEVNESEESADLYAALRPSSRAAIHLVGGLPAPDGVGWMAGGPPGVWVCAFQDQVELCLTSLADTVCDVSWKIDANAPGRPLDLPEELPSGPYLLTARVGGRLLTERVIELRTWDDLEARVPEMREYATVSGHRLCGATLHLPAQ